jgi:hypothetical protein
MCRNVTSTTHDQHGFDWSKYHANWLVVMFVRLTAPTRLFYDLESGYRGGIPWNWRRGKGHGFSRK